VASYADLIVLRHPLAGSARLAADYSHVPVINAGDGGHEHPTQTLCDLYTLRTTRGRIEGLKVVLYGDLKHGRTTHSLAKALVRMGADVLAIPVPRLELPSYVVEEMRQVESLDVREAKLSGLDVALGGVRNGTLFSHKPAGWGTNGDCIGLEDVALDALYVTRIQKERLNELESSAGNPLPNVDTAFLSAPQFSDAVVLHPLPRLDEIDPEVDSDPRGIYFQQAALGVPIRMALLSVLLGRETLRAEPPPSTCSPVDPEGGVCRNSACIMSTESDYLEQLAVQSETDGTLRCQYCESDLRTTPSI
jgi:aspartate carbamoyltransferase catalytic subunit